MGSCTSKDKVATPYSPNRNEQNFKKPNKNQSSNRQQQRFGIESNTLSKSLKFNHSPLRNCQFLFSKFKKSDGTPQQLNLGFMVTKCTIDIENREITISCINSKQIKIWIIYGGFQRVSQTGLTLEINNFKQIEQVTIKKPSNNNKQGDKLGAVKLRQKPSQNILIILEPLLQNSQTLFMIYRYQIIPNQKQYTLITQSLQWSSLAFKIEDIYGSEHLFKCNDENEVCSICLTSKSECILLPCRHMCVCSACHQQVEKTKPICPLCRKQYYSVVKYQNN